MEIRYLNELCKSHLVQTLDKRFNMESQRNKAMKSELQKATRKGIVAILFIIAFVIFPAPVGDPRFLAGRILVGIIALIQIIGILGFAGKFFNFGKNRSLEQIQSYYSSIFLQTTDKYRTTPRDRNRSLKKSFQENLDLFPYPLVSYFVKDGYKKFLYEWNELLRMYPLWKIDICAIRTMFTNLSVGKIRVIRIEIDYRVEEQLKTFVLFNAIVELKGVYFLVSPFPYFEE